MKLNTFVKNMRKFKGVISFTAIALGLGLAFINIAAATASETTTDVKGAIDFNLLKRYPQSHVVMFEEFPDRQQHILILGALKKIKNVLAPKKSQRIDGSLTRITYRIPDGVPGIDVFEYFRSQIVAAGKILFNCKQRQCGSSNYWANTVFKRAELYGPEENQYLLVGEIHKDNRHFITTVYVIRRGNRKMYVHLEIIEADLMESLEPESMLSELQANGFVNLENLKFDPANQLIDDPAVIDKLVKLFQIDSSLRVHIVAHAEDQGDLASATLISEQRAEQLLTKLVESGVTVGRLTAHGVGPLAPAKRLSANRITLVSQN